MGRKRKRRKDNRKKERARNGGRIRNLEEMGRGKGE